MYCPQFHRLFSELGKYLHGPVVGSQKEGTLATPLVDATVQFLKEFMPPAPSSSDSKTKGKEREEEDFWEPDSFIPTFVYDVMKEKKRFANMVVGSFILWSSSKFETESFALGWSSRGRGGVLWIFLGHFGGRVAYDCQLP